VARWRRAHRRSGVPPTGSSYSLRFLVQNERQGKAKLTGAWISSRKAVRGADVVVRRRGRRCSRGGCCCRCRGRRLRARRSPGARSGAAVRLWGHGGAAGRLVHGGAELGSGAEDSAALVGFEGGAADGIPGRGRGLRSNRAGSDPRCASRRKSRHARSRATDSRADPKLVRGARCPCCVRKERRRAVLRWVS